MGKRLFPAGWAATLLAGVAVAAVALGPVVPAARAQASQTEPAITDVPPEHWAYQAVVTLVQRGYLTLQAGRFDGSRPVDRYTLAAVIARLLQDIERGQTRLSGDDLRLVRQLTNEFREELARWQDQRAQLNQRLDAQARDMSRIDGKLTEVLAQFSQSAAAADRRLTQVEQATQTLNQQIAGVSQRVSQVETTAKGLATVTQDLGARLDGFGGRVNALEQDLAQRKVELVGMSQSVQALERTTASLQSQIQALSQDLAGQIRAEGQATSQKIEASAAQLQQLQATLQAQQQELGTLRSTLQTLVTSLSQSGIQPEKAGALLSAQQESLQRLQASVAQIDRLNADLDALRQQLAASEQERQKLASEVSGLRASLEQERARTDEIVRNLVRDTGGQLTSQRNLQAEVESLRMQNRWLMAAALAGLVLAVAGLIVR